MSYPLPSILLSHHCSLPYLNFCEIAPAKLLYYLAMKSYSEKSSSEKSSSEDKFMPEKSSSEKSYDQCQLLWHISQDLLTELKPRLPVKKQKAFEKELKRFVQSLPTTLLREADVLAVSQVVFRSVTRR